MVLFLLPYSPLKRMKAILLIGCSQFYFIYFLWSDQRRTTRPWMVNCMALRFLMNMLQSEVNIISGV